MKTSAKGIELIKKFESFQPKRYICPAGKPTIGYGHVIQRGEDHLNVSTLTEASATALLARDLKYFEVSIEIDMLSLNQNQFDACVSLAFNIGAQAFSSSTLVKMIRAGDMVGAQAQFARWNKSNGKVLPGLVRRRAEEAALFGAKP
jgi:lysozyme